MKTRLCLHLTGFILLSCHFTIAQPTELSLKLKKGDSYTLSMSSNMNANQTVFGAEMNSELKVNSIANFLVKSAKKDLYELEVSYQSLNLDLKLPETNISFSSESNDERDIFSSVLKKLIDQPFEMCINNKGKITSISKIQDVFDNAFASFSDLPASKVKQVEGQLMKAFGLEALKGNLQTVLTIFPEAPVKNKEEWQVNTSFNNGMSSSILSTYQLKEMIGKAIFIEGNSTISSAEKDAYFELNGRYFKYDLSGIMDSEITLDTKTGWVKQAEITQEIGGDSFLKPNSQVPDGVKIPIIIRNEITVLND